MLSIKSKVLLLSTASLSATIPLAFPWKTNAVAEEKTIEYIGEFDLSVGNSPKGKIAMKVMLRDINGVLAGENERICRAEHRFKNTAETFYFSHEKCKNIRVLWDDEDSPEWKITEELPPSPSAA